MHIIGLQQDTHAIAGKNQIKIISRIERVRVITLLCIKLIAQVRDGEKENALSICIIIPNKVYSKSKWMDSIPLVAHFGEY